MGYKIRVDSSMFGGANQKAIDDEVSRKKKEYDDNLQLLEISKLYKERKVIKIFLSSYRLIMFKIEPNYIYIILFASTG